MVTVCNKARCWW